MRILVTNMGEQLFKATREEIEIQRKAKIDFQKSNPHMKKKMKGVSKSQTQIKLGHSPKNLNSPLKNTPIQNTKQQIENLEFPQIGHSNERENSVNSHHAHHTKNLRINQKKLFIPKQILDRYNSNVEEDKNTKESIIDRKETRLSIIQSLQKNTQSQQLTPNHSLKDSFTLKEIIKPNVCDDLRKKLNMKMQLKSKSPITNESNFRSEFTKNKIEDLENNLNREIKADSVNLIRYLNSKSEVHESLVNRLNEYDDEKINRLNKVCQRIFYNDECEIKMKDRITNLLKAQKLKDLADYKNRLAVMGAEVVQIKNILDVNRKPFNERDRYAEKYKDIQKVWERNKINQLIIKDKKGGLDTSTVYSKSILINQNDISQNILNNISKDGVSD